MDKITIHMPNWPIIHQPYGWNISVDFHGDLQAYQREYVHSPDPTVRQSTMFAKDLTLLASVATKWDDCLPTLAFDPNKPIASEQIKDQLPIARLYFRAAMMGGSWESRFTSWTTSKWIAEANRCFLPHNLDFNTACLDFMEKVQYH
ncbi:hypothetical protein O6H91_Y463900 [Diphasiastrum complanatum]|nr:hypothetical protein O6H91_Y463900 [Diphasiastrum complanatum]